MMINKKLEAAPWQEQGRWYHFLIESDGTDATITTSDIEDADIDSSGNLLLPEGFKVVDSKFCINCVGTEANAFTPSYMLVATDEQIGLALPDVASYDYLDLWIFGYYA